MNRHPLFLAISLVLATSSAGWAQDHGERAQELDEIVVTASPLRQTADEIVRPVETLAGHELDDQRAATIGETVTRIPGVQTSFFGPGVGRPIIRGLDGARVQMLSEGLSSLDVSTVSVDHAVTIEPFLADQIEVLKGPSTLLFGPGAIGGAVNVVDGRIHEARADGISGRAEVRGDTAADERAGMFRIDAGAGNFVLHADAFYRETDDYEIPGAAELHDDHDDDHDDDDNDHDHENEHTDGVLENSATRTRGGALGFSYISDRGFAGLAVSRYESRYGVPGHAHHHEEDEHDGDGDDDHDHEEEEAVTLDLKQTRIDFKAGLDQPFAGHDALRIRLARNDYEHTEFEGEEVGTQFDNTGYEGRLELVHNAIGRWTGAYGLQFGRRDFEAIGEEAFVPPSETSDLGLFLIERGSWDRFNLEIGARYDRVKTEPDADAGVPDAEHDSFSASAAGEWRFAEGWHLRLGLDRAQRAPVAEELYSNGAHVATQSVEIGDPTLGRETANQVELGLHYHSDSIEMKLAVYNNRFNDFIYLADTGEEDDELPVRQWSQADARFRGAEAEVAFALADNASGRYELRFMADTVRGELADGGNLPRIAPGRYGAGFDWSLGGWRAGLSALRYREQDRVAEFETPTDGYTMVDADLAYAFAAGETELEVFVQGRNLTDQEARLHTSFLKDQAPLAGRSFAAGLRAFF